MTDMETDNQPQPSALAAVPEVSEPAASGPVPFGYVIELLSKEEFFIEMLVTKKGWGRIKIVTRCSVCLFPATKKETFTGDPLYQRPLCDKHAAEKAELNTADRTKLTALQEQRLRRGQPTLALHKVTRFPMSADLHRIAQREKHEAHNPSCCVPKPPKSGHMTKHQMAIKSAALRIFRRMYVAAFNAISGHAMSLGKEPVMLIQQLHKIGARAGVLGAIEVEKTNKTRRRKAQDAQKRSRRINYGIS